MKFIIDGNEITNINTASIQGAMNLVSRCASFSYIYAPDNGFNVFKAKLNSNVLIKNNNNENIFCGKISNIYYNPLDKTIQIQAEDILSLFAKLKVTGRFKGTLTNIFKQLTKNSYFIQKISNFLNNNFDIINPAKNLIKNKKEPNIVSFGELSAFDIIQIAALKQYGLDFKIYITGDSKIKFLIPQLSMAKKELLMGKNILSASFRMKNGENYANIKAIGDDSIVSGSTIKVTDSNTTGYFIVEKDSHIYSDIYTMELELKERNF